MRKLIDLSQPIENKGHARPFHPTPVVWTHLSHEESAPIWKKGGFSAMVKGVIVSDHSGSHTDAYTHMDTRPSAESIDQLPLHRFFTEAVSIDNPAATLPDADPPYPAHQVCRDRKVLNTENLIIPQELVGRRFTYIGFPIKIVGGTGGWIRAVAVLDER